ncbi:neutral ceramidase [Frankliniella occidentalis]|uniref:Neutral ceramidase n=1 Tax=Frankliniella occidentalis TaxID=133901 RepID=A0A9C6WYC6_FRAOC|nr:neutral ceramidase [Frankliniella occidentalis]
MPPDAPPMSAGRRGASSAACLLVVHALALISLVPGGLAVYLLGTGIADVTGPAAEVPFMGYASPSQKGQGIHTRQFSRAFIFQDAAGERLAFVCVDVGMIGSGVRKEVLKRLAPLGGYTDNTLMLSGTHTHSAPGGFLMHLLFDITTMGFVKESFDGLVEGITLSVQRAHNSMAPGRLFFVRGVLDGVSVNRSPTAYRNNPQAERDRYATDTDKDMVQLRLVRDDGRPLGVINWFAVHPTSMNNSNQLVSSDNVGAAALFFERKMNGAEAIPGKGPFVAAFASSNLGDVSPNTRGPRCQYSGRDCEMGSSTCPGGEVCIAAGPGQDMFESTRIIADRLSSKAWELWTMPRARELKGPLFAVHQYTEMPGQEADFFDVRSNSMSKVRACLPAMGYSFAAGTTDGAGAFQFQQGTRSTNPLWNSLRNFIMEPSKGQVACHGAKPILLTTGEMNFPFQWQPTIVSHQLAAIGDLALACVPGEFTTMAGRRLRATVHEALQGGAQATRGPEDVVIVGLCNTYSDYITTPEEYEVQRYEGASTIYGPHTLTVHLKIYRSLAASVLGRALPDPGPTPPEMMNDLISLLPPVLFDSAMWEKSFGEVLEQPEDAYGPGDIVHVSFVSGHLRNNPRREDTFLTVERREREGWKVVATDANWETKLIWNRVSAILGTSRVIVQWTVPMDAPEGDYRISHFGHYKKLFSDIVPYHGTSREFKVTNDLDTGAADELFGK